MPEWLPFVLVTWAVIGGGGVMVSAAEWATFRDKFSKRATLFFVFLPVSVVLVIVWLVLQGIGTIRDINWRN